MSQKRSISCSIETEVDFDPDDYIENCSDDAVINEFVYRELTIPAENEKTISYNEKLNQIKEILEIPYYSSNERIIKEIELLF